ncbi:ABC transporter permease [Chloroflexota bacterium]
MDFGWNAIKVIDEVVDWIVISWDPFFDFVLAIVIGILVPFRDLLLWLPWWLVIIAVALASWKMVNKWFALTSVLFMVFMLFMGLFDLTMMTLAIVLTATLFCVVVGVPIGIIAAKSERFDGILRPVLDMMQTMPSFVYLIPALMLFGLGMTPAIMATCIYAVPPIVRLTNLGIRQVDASVVEASRSFGSTTWQLLSKVQVPLAMPTILAGLNQTVMMALSMVVLASMIGASGLGEEVLRGIARVEPGRGFIGGTAIVFTAIILDRISQGFAKRPENRTTS